MPREKRRAHAVEEVDALLTARRLALVDGSEVEDGPCDVAANGCARHERRRRVGRVEQRVGSGLREGVVGRVGVEGLRRRVSEESEGLVAARAVHVAPAGV